MIKQEALASSICSMLAAVFVATAVPGTARTSRIVEVNDFKNLVINGDWAPAIRAAITVASSGDTVEFARNQRYNLSSVVLINKPSLTLDGRNALIEQTTLEAATGDLILFRVAASDVHFSRLKLQASTAPKPRGPVEFLIEATNAGVRMRIDHCSFGLMPFSTSAAQAGVGFRVGADGGSVISNTFATGVGGVFTQGRVTMIANNVFRRPGDMSIAFNGTGASGGIAVRNEIQAEGLTISGSIGIEEGASNFRISYNRIVGGHGPGIWCVRVAAHSKSSGGQIDHNWIDGRFQVGRNPTALLAITDNCANITISDNIFINAPVGHAGNAVVILPTDGIRFVRNRVIPGPKAIGYGLLIYPSGGNFSFEDNRYVVSAGVPAVSTITNGRQFHLTASGNQGFKDLPQSSLPTK